MMSARKEFICNDDDNDYIFYENNKQRYLRYPWYRGECNRCSIRLTVVVIVESICLVVCIPLIVVRAGRSSETGTGPNQSVPYGNVTEKTDMTYLYPAHALCFNCSEIYGNSTTNDTADTITLNKEINMCCMEDVGNLKELFFLIINEYYRDKVVGPAAGHDRSASTPLGFWTRREAAAHMFLDNIRLKSSNETVGGLGI